MFRLPAISDGVTTWRVPLHQQAEQRLADALLEDGVEIGRQRLSLLLAEEPTLALWACIRWRQSESAASAINLATLAEWFYERRLELLDWDDEISQQAASADQIDRWAGLAAESLAEAKRTPDALRAPAYLRGLLHNARDWMNSFLVEGDAERESSPLLPAWLEEPWRQQPASSREPEIAPLEIASFSVQQVCQCWRFETQDSTTGPGRLVPRLMKKMRRLEELEHRFDTTLHRAKMAAMKELAYGASHEINNPLANISTRAQTLLRDETDPERRRKLATINRQAFRAHEMITNLMQFANPPQIHPEQVDLVGLVDQVIEELSEEAEQQGTALSRQTPGTESLVAWVDPTHLSMALKALCINSLEALGSGGHIQIVAERVLTRPDRAESRAGVTVQVRDTGPGIPPEVREHLFDPFYSGREAGRGLGLGLSKCWRIVTLHEGVVDVSSDVRGSTFTLWLPDSRSATEPKAVAAAD